MLRTLLIAAAIVLAVRYLYKVFKPKPPKQEVKGEPMSAGKNIPDNQIQDVKFRDLPDDKS